MHYASVLLCRNSTTGCFFVLLETDSYELENGERTDRIKRSEVRPAQSVTINQDDLRILKAFRQEFHRIGRGILYNTLQMLISDLDICCFSIVVEVLFFSLKFLL